MIVCFCNWFVNLFRIGAALTTEGITQKSSTRQVDTGRWLPVFFPFTLLSFLKASLFVMKIVEKCLKGAVLI